MVEILPNQSARKRVMSFMGRDPGEHKFFKVHCNTQIKKGTKKKQKHEHQHIGCTFSPKFLQQMWGAAYCKNTRETCHKFA